MRPIKTKKWLFIATLIVTLSTSFAIQAERQNLSSSKGVKYDELGQQFTKLVAEHNFIAADKLINYDAYAKRVAEIVFESASRRTAFSRGIKQGITESSFSEKIFIAALEEPATFKYLGLNKNRVPIVRIDFTNGGHEYIKLIVRPSSKGKLLISDFMFASTGELSSVATANAAKYLVQPAESILKRLLGGIEPNKELLASFDKLGKLRKEGKSKQAYELVQSFPDKLKNEREFLHLSIGFASAFDEDVYRGELSRLDKLYGDDSKNAFMLIDHYFYQEDWGKAINAIDASRREWADDGALNVILAEIFTQDGQVDAATSAAERAIKLEPNNENTYWSALASYNKAARFDDVVSVLNTLKDQFQYSFESETFVENPEYSELVKSDAFKAWVDE